MKITKKILGLAMSLLIVSMFTVNASAAEPVAEKAITLDERDYVIINGETIVYAGEDYENPETGEYFRWGNTRGIDKSFSFFIRYSVESSSFKINGNSVSVTSLASVTDAAGNTVSGYSGHRYSVTILGLLYDRSLEFSVNGTESGTISGLINGGSYRVKITNSDSLSDTRYLSGYGTISS